MAFCQKALFKWYYENIRHYIKRIQLVWYVHKIQFWFRCQILKRKTNVPQYIFGDGNINYDLYNRFIHHLDITGKLQLMDYAILNKAPILCAFFMAPDNVKLKISNLAWIINMMTHPIVYEFLPDSIKKDRYLGPIYARLHMKHEHGSTINDYPVEIRDLI